MNPIQMIKGMMGINNPKEMVMQMLGQNNNNPIFKNLIDMANKGDTKGVENFARNYMKEQGRNYDEEFNKFINNFGLKK
jgi:hypothetical protein